MQIGDIVVHRAVVLHGIGQTAGIIEEVNGIAAPGHAHELTAGVVVTVGGAVHSLADSQTAGIIGKAQAGAGFGSCCQTSAVGPCHRPAGAVVVAGGVADYIVGNAVAVICGKQVLPGSVTIGVGMSIGCQDIACTIVGIGVGGIPNGFEKLALVVVGVGNRGFPGNRVGGDVTHGIIGIAILLPAAGHGCHLHGGLGAVNVPIGKLPGYRPSGDRSQPPQAIVAHSQGIAHTGGHGVQAAIGRIVGVSLRVGRTVQLPDVVGS